MDRIAPRSLPPSEQAIKVVESLKVLPVKDFSALQQDSSLFPVADFQLSSPDATASDWSREGIVLTGLVW